MSEVHFIGGEKGGVGKSMVARLLAQYFIDRDIAWRGFDADLSHGALIRYYSGFAEPLDMDRFEALDRLMETAIEMPQSRLLVDLAAQSERKLHAWAEGVDLSDLTAEMGVDLILWHVMDDGKDSVRLLERLFSRYGDSVRYVIVKNAVRGEDFTLFEQSSAGALAQQWQLPVLSLRALPHSIMRKIDQLDQSFWAAAHNHGGNERTLGLMERQRVKTWMRHAYGELDKLGMSVGD